MSLMRVFKSNCLGRTGFFGLITVITAFCVLLMSSLAVSASTVTINDPQHVLNASQVQSEGQKLSYPLDIYVTNNFSGTRSQFDQHVKQDINSSNKIVMAIDTGHKYLAIAGGTGVPLSNSQYQDAVNAFSSNFNNGDYTGATIASMRSLESALPAQSNSTSNNTQPSNNTASGGITGNLTGTLCCVGLVILVILGALFFVLRRRGGFGGWRRNVPPYQQPMQPYNQYNQGYPPGYGPGYPGYNQRSGMNPWAAGGMGAAAGGLIGYELGKEQGEEQAREQQGNNNDNQIIDGGGFGGGAGGGFGGNDNGGFGGGAGGDFGGGDWGGGGGNDWGGGGGGGGAGGNF